MLEGFRICLDWRTRKELPDLQQSEILDKVSNTVVEMVIENGKMARTLHEILLKLYSKKVLTEEDCDYLRNSVVGNLGRQYADPFAKEEHEN